MRREGKPIHNRQSRHEVYNAFGAKIGGSGTATYLPQFTDTRVIATPVDQETVNANTGFGGSVDNYFKLPVVGDVSVGESAFGNGIVLASQPIQ